MVDYKCKRCGRVLIPQQTLFMHFKVLEIYYVTRIDTHKATKSKPGVCLCSECMKEYDQFLQGQLIDAIKK